MQTLLAERPMILSMMIGMLAVGFIYGWLQTGKRAMGIVGLVFVLLIPGTFAMASYWVTDREQIQMVLYDAAAAVENNQFEEVYELIHMDEARQRAETVLPNFRFEIARINNIRSVKVIEGTIPLEADVDLTAKAVMHTKRGNVTYRGPRRLLLRMQKIGDQWVVIDYRDMNVVGQDNHNPILLNQ